MKPAEVAAPVTPVAPPVVEVVPEPVIVPVPEPKVETAPVAPPVVKAAPAPMPEPDGVDFEAAPSQPRKLDLSIPIIIISLLMLAAITAFIWKIVDDKDHTNSIPAIQTMHNAAVAPDTSKLAAMSRTDTITQIVHDTVKVIQVQQAAEHMLPMADAKAAAPRSVATVKAKVHDMPVMPTYDYLYVDKPYYFDLKTPLLSKEEFDLYSENAAITPLGENTYYVKPTKAGPLTVVVATKGDHTKVIEAVYNVKTKPTPVATLGDDIIGGFVSPKILLAKLTLQAKSEAGNYKVKSFRMTCRSGSCDINDVSNDGKFNESMIRFLHNVRSGERLYFDNITAEDENGQTVHLNDIQVTTY
jgi:hypothetical protein